MASDHLAMGADRHTLVGDAVQHRAGRGRLQGQAEEARGIEAGIAVFRIAVERWVDEANARSLPELVRDSFGQLRAVTAGR